MHANLCRFQNLGGHVECTWKVHLLPCRLPCTSSLLYRGWEQAITFGGGSNIRDNDTLGCGLPGLMHVNLQTNTQTCTDAHTNTLTRPQIDLTPFANYLYIFTLLLTQALFSATAGNWFLGVCVCVCEGANSGPDGWSFCCLAAIEIHCIWSTHAKHHSVPAQQTGNLFRLALLFSLVEFRVSATQEELFDCRKKQDWMSRGESCPVLWQRISAQGERQVYYGLKLDFKSHRMRNLSKVCPSLSE